MEEEKVGRGEQVMKDDKLKQTYYDYNYSSSSTSSVLAEIPIIN